MTRRTCSCDPVSENAVCVVCGGAPHRDQNADVAAPGRPRSAIEIGALRLTLGGRHSARVEPAGAPPRLAESFEDSGHVIVERTATAAIWDALDGDARAVCLQSAPGAGATTQLQVLAGAAREHGFTNGALIATQVRGPAADVAARIAAQLAPVATAGFPTRTQLGGITNGTRRLILLDRADLTAADVRDLIELFPGFAFVIANAQALPSFPNVVLGALPPVDALAVLEARYGRRIDQDNRRVALELCATAGSLPGLLRPAGAAARELHRSFLSLHVQFHSGDTIVREFLARLPETEAHILRVLALAQAPLAAHHIAYIVRSAEIRAPLEHLAACELVRTGRSGLFEAPRCIAERIPAAEADADDFMRVVEISCDVIDSQRALPVFDRQLWALESILDVAVERAQWDAVLSLGPRLADAFAARGAFGAWGRVLEIIVSTAGRSGDSAALAAARHELGVRAALLGERDLADADASGAAVLAFAAEARSVEAATPHPNAAPAPAVQVTDVPVPSGAVLLTGSFSRMLLVLGLGLAVIAMVVISFTHRRPAPPQITALSAAPTAVVAGRGTDLCVDAANTAVVELFPDGVRLTEAGRHCVHVRPAATTTYTAVGTSADGRQVQRSVVVAVTQPPDPARISEFAVRPALVKPGQPVRLCYAVTGAHELHIVPRVGTLTRLRACQTLVLHDPHRYRYTLSARGDDGRVVVREANVQVAAAAAAAAAAAEKRPAAVVAAVEDERRTREAVYQFDATPSVVERGQATSLCVGVDRPARGFVTHVGPLPPGITRCYRVTPSATTVYRLYVALERATAVETVTVAVRPAARARETAGSERR